MIGKLEKEQASQAAAIIRMKMLSGQRFRHTCLLFLAVAAVGGLLFYWLSRPAPLAEAQAATIATTIIDNSNTPVSGGWQIGAPDADPAALNGQKYRLWAFKQHGVDHRGQSYPNRIACSWQRNTGYDAGGAVVDISRITFDMQLDEGLGLQAQSYSHPDVENIEADEDKVFSIERMERAATPGQAVVKVDGLEVPGDFQLYADSRGSAGRAIETPYQIDCHSLALDANIANPSLNLGDNLTSRPNFLQTQVSATNSGWLTAVNPAKWPLGHSSSNILNQKPFLVLGNTQTGGAGFRNHSLELNLWIPDSDDPQDIILGTDNLCDDTGWDTGGGNADFSIYLQGAAGPAKRIQLASESNCSLTQLNLNSMGINVGGIGGPVGPNPRRSITTKKPGGGTQEELYKRYKIIAEIDVPDTNEGYTNQFRITVNQPTNSYLGIGRTRDSGSDYNPATALSASSRLPEVYKRLEAFWTSDLYLAADASKGCSGKETKRIGFYDSDYLARGSLTKSFGLWQQYKGQTVAGFTREDMKPAIDIYEAPRDLFLQQRASLSTSPVKTLIFDGLEGGSNVSHNQWEYESFDFEFDKIYLLRLRNIEQRTWIQLGLPYDQINALQKCTDKPLIKVYHAGVAVGGRFGSGTSISTCRDDDLSVPDPAPALYAHAALGDKGSSSEYGAYVRGKINAFYSNFERSKPPPSPANKLTFANSNSPWGGLWGGQLRCLPNYWRRASQLTAEDTSLSSFDLASLTDNSELLYQPDSGSLQLTNSKSGIHLDRKATVYIEGDLYIKENILNENFNRDRFNNLKALYLIVKGDILIDHTVNRIDAILIAMPSSDLKNTPLNALKEGRIHTCYTPDVIDPSVDLHNPTSLSPAQQRYARDCLNYLTINGALIARQIRLGRTTSSATPILSTYPVAEEVNLWPSYSIGIPRLPTYGDWLYGSDSITILPVNF